MAKHKNVLNMSRNSSKIRFLCNQTCKKNQLIIKLSFSEFITSFKTFFLPLWTKTDLFSACLYIKAHRRSCEEEEVPLFYLKLLSVSQEQQRSLLFHSHWEICVFNVDAFQYSHPADKRSFLFDFLAKWFPVFSVSVEESLKMKTVYLLGVQRNKRRFKTLLLTLFFSVTLFAELF